MKIRRPLHSDLEELIFAEDESIDFKAVIAIHSTLLGPAVCGVQYMPYDTDKEAIEDATTLAERNTFRATLANIPFGGAAGIILAPLVERPDRTEIFRAFGRLVDSLEGRLIATEDIGTTPADIDEIAKESAYACGGLEGGLGDPSYFTALGVLRGMEAAVKRAFKTDSLTGLRVALLGLGQVGFKLAEMLTLAGVDLIAYDRTMAKCDRAERELYAEIVSLDAIKEVKCDILSPCTTGGIFDTEAIEQIKAKIVAGSAKRQLVHPHGGALRLMQRRIHYLPEFALNAGGLYTNACEILGYDASYAAILTNGIYETIERILDISANEKCSTYDTAMRMVEDKLKQARRNRLKGHLG